jgi:hypothetical protein
MKKLLKAYNFNSDMQYYEMIVDSVINGQHTQAKEQFLAMPKANKKAFLTSLFGDWLTPLRTSDKLKFISYL